MPERGRGGVWQRSYDERQVKLVAAGGVATALLLMGVAALAIPRGGGDEERLALENQALREELHAVEKRVAEIEPMIQRVQAFDEQLRQLDAKKALPGMGDLSPQEWQARQDWIDGVVGIPAAEEPGALADRVEDLVDELASLDLGDLDTRLAEISEARSTLPQIWPVEGVLTSRFGWRVSPYGDHSWRFHKGVDLGVPYGTPILDTGDGVVVFSGWDSGHGNMVVVDHGDDVATRYCHASTLLVAVGDEVYTGDMLALAGSTGISTGPHLHYELWIDGEPVDPLPYLPSGG